jgi:DNA polymerase III subunit delta
MSSCNNAYLLIGNDEFCLNAAAKQLVESLVPPGARAFGLEVISGRTSKAEDTQAVLRACLVALDTQGFLTSGKVVWLRDALFLGDPRVCSSPLVKPLMGELADAVKHVERRPNTIVVTAPDMDRRSGLFKAFAEQKAVREFEMPARVGLARKVAIEQASLCLDQHGIAAQPAVIEALIDVVGADSGRLHSEFEKLSLYVGARRAITLRDIQDVVTASVNVLSWDLTDAVGDRDLPEALAALQRLLAQQESSIGLLLALSRRVNDLRLYREAEQRGWIKAGHASDRGPVHWLGLPASVEQVFSEELEQDPRKAHPFFAGKLAKQATHYTASELRRNQTHIAAAFGQLVGSGLADAWVLQMLLVKLISRE